MDYLPKFKARAGAVTFGTTAAVTGGRLVSITAPRAVANSTADSQACIGVAVFDVEAGDPVSVFLRPFGVHPRMASGPITAGDRVGPGANGTVQTTATKGAQIGTALETVTAGSLVEVMFAGNA